MNMKRRMVWVIMCIVLISKLAVGQSLRTESSLIIEPLPVGLTTMKTTNLIFPMSVIGIDRGSKDVLAQKAAGVENVVQVKAASDSMRETNLTVITSDGGIYSFLLTVGAPSGPLNILVGNGRESTPVGILEEGKVPSSVMEKRAAFADNSRGFLNITGKAADVKMELRGIYVSGDEMYFPVSFTNAGNMNYTVDQLRFFITDKKVSTRTAVQEIEQKPVRIINPPETIFERSTLKTVFILPKFTIPDQKRLIIQLMEKNGGRNIELKISNRSITKAKAFPF